MNDVLSYGAGVHSTAALVLLKPKRAIFADTGAEWPETYDYIRSAIIPFCDANDIELSIVFNQRWTLEEMALHDRVAPARTMRWCSDKFKMRVINAWLNSSSLLPVRQVIGFDVNEQHRCKASGRPDVENVFPLIERGLDREACRSIILAAGLPLSQTPRNKSGCWFCPFSSKSDLITLKRSHADLFARAERIELNSSGYDRGFFLVGDKPLGEHIRSGRIRYNEDQTGLFDCACYEGQMT